jgi:alpha-L-fucosidase
MGHGGKTDDPAKQEEWNRLLRKQWEEVLTLCGKDLVREVWFDGGCVVPLGDIIRRLAPNAVVLQDLAADIRWVGNEDGITADPNWNTLRATDLKTGGSTQAQSTPDGDAWAPVECDTPLYDHYWFWSEWKERNTCKGLDVLLERFLESAGRGSVYLLNATPNTSGQIPERDAQLYSRLGEAIDRAFGHPVGRIAGVVGAEVVVKLGKAQSVDCVDLWEDYRYGHRIRRYEVDAWVDGDWRRVSHGTAIGRRKIDLFPEVVTDKVRVRVLENVGTPLFREVRVNRTGRWLGSPES